MYCPKCLNAALRMSKKGVVEIIINGKQRDTGRFLYNKEREDKEEILQHLELKVDEFFQWYSGLENQGPIETFQLVSSAFVCDNGCPISVTQKFNVTELLFTGQEIKKLLVKMSKKYQISIKLKDE